MNLSRRSFGGCASFTVKSLDRPCSQSVEEGLGRDRESIGDTRRADGHGRSAGTLAMSDDRRSLRSSLTSSKSRRFVEDASSQASSRSDRASGVSSTAGLRGRRPPGEGWPGMAHAMFPIFTRAGRVPLPSRPWSQWPRSNPPRRCCRSSDHDRRQPAGGGASGSRHSG